MNDTPRDIFDRVAKWPKEDQEELAEVALEIEGRRNGAYVLNADEKDAIDAARHSRIASDEEVASLWKKLGIA